MMADEINIDFTNKTDSGLTITFNADLNAGLVVLTITQCQFQVVLVS